MYQDNIKKFHDERGYTIILVSHSMEEVAQYANRLIVIDSGKIAMDGSPRQLFVENSDKLKSLGLGVPQVTELMNAIRLRGYSVNCNVITVEVPQKACPNGEARCEASQRIPEE